MKTNINQTGVFSRNKAGSGMTQTRISRWVNWKPRLIFLTVALIVGLVLGGGQPASTAKAAPIPLPKVLVLYDNAGPSGWYGDLDRQLLMNLLGHFAVTVTSKPV